MYEWGIVEKVLGNKTGITSYPWTVWPEDFRVIVCLTPPQMNDFCDLLGTPYAPVSKIAPVKGQLISKCLFEKMGQRRLWMGLNRRYFWNWCIRSTKQITEIIHLWWGETNYHSEVPRWRGTPLNPLLGVTVTPLILDAVLKTKSCVSHWIFYFFLK